MNTHKDARLTLARRLEMVLQMTAGGLSTRTAKEWLGRYLVAGEAGLGDRSSRPGVSPGSITAATAVSIVELRRKRLAQARIAAWRLQEYGRTRSGHARAIKLSDLDPVGTIETIVRYEHEAPGDLLHIDIKKLGHIERLGQRVTGNRRDIVEGAGCECLFVAIDDHAHIGFTDMYPDEQRLSAIPVPAQRRCLLCKLGHQGQALAQGRWPAFRSCDFARACLDPGARHKFTRPYRPQTNGKAQRFIQSALRGWAYGVTYQRSVERTHALNPLIHHTAGTVPTKASEEPHRWLNSSSLETTCRRVTASL